MVPPNRGSRLVDIVRIDDFLCTADEPVSFIKIDVEGMEVDVLRGARETIMRHRPIMMMEMDHKLTDLGELQKFLVESGYGFDQYGPNYLCMPL